jgi:SRP19 protein
MPAGEGPTALELCMACKQLNLWHALEPNKGYPREPYVTGRVRVRITLPDGSPANPEVPDSKLLQYFAYYLYFRCNSRAQ